MSSRARPRVSSVTFARAQHADRQRGLLGWVSLVLDDSVLLDGIALRRTANGHLKLSFPARRDRDGRAHPYVRPLDNEARLAIEEQVLAALDLAPECTP